MTREEAVQTIKGERWICCIEKYREALDMAIKALEQEPCEDCISRQVVLNLPRKTLKNYFGDVVAEVINVRDIMELPSVTPQSETGHWIALGNYDDYGKECTYKCSKCGDINDYHDNYCPECGAKMVEVRKKI